jgi:hypothetical protein
MMRREVRELVALGPLPNSGTATQEHVESAQRLIEAIQPPLTHEEAHALVSVFGDDDSFGLAWTLLHLIEATPGWPFPGALPSQSNNEWVQRLRDRRREELD